MESIPSREPAAPTELPPKYYLDYFQFLVTFVERLYGDILNSDEKEFIRGFRALSEDAQCLFVRFSNRRGLFFRTSKLKYNEIEDIPAALYELEDKGFIKELSAQHESYALEILNLFTKEEWIKLAPPTELSLKPLKKPDLIRYLNHTYTFGLLVDQINSVNASDGLGVGRLKPSDAFTETVIKVGFEVEVMMLKFLFFGNRYADMTEFVVRDLGKVNFERYRDDAYTARFPTRQDAEDKLMVSLMAEQFYEMQEATTPPEEIFDWFMNWQASIHTLGEVAQPGYIKLINRIGVYLERQKLPEQALTVYQLTDHIPSRERRVRLLHRMGYLEEAIALCEAIAQDPQNADERFFALDFQEKIANAKKRVKKSVTRFLQDSESVQISIDFKYRVEQGVVEYFINNGRVAVHAENYPWRGLFGLIFWDIIYDTNVQAIHHPLQRMPSDFYQPDFYRKRVAQIRQRLSELETSEKVAEILESTFIEKFGIANVLVDWNEVLLELVKLMALNLTPMQLRAILLEMATNLRENTRGFPDLMVWDEKGLELIEVKSPTDHLSSQQLHWMHFMADLGVKARVLRVEWEMPTASTNHQAI
ncbi:VRR-NUC domain-containing protein [Runella aurantiaca]|uniref:phosphodiesterase I n=1 Tax=Runella aurantiaca TaxID=2282308 RepID=A0A369I2H1_9BACT|nr:VRR-NUC domain-containing protein [Runella aurantiaca]RDB03758.1 VRR-NUC domain-containing protein [Runella aurantiaca]